MPAFKPPKPTLVEGLKTLLICVDTDFGTEAFASGLQRTFVKVCLEKKTDGTYSTYNAHRNAGWLDTSLLEPHEKAVRIERQGSGNFTLTFGEVATEFIIEPSNETHIEVECFEQEDKIEDGSEHA